MKLLYLLMLGFIFNYTFSKETDSSKTIVPFIKPEFGIGASNVLYNKKDYKNFSHHYVSYEFNLIAGIKIKEFYISSGLGLKTFSNNIKNILLLNPYDPVNGNIDKADAHYEKLYMNIPIIFAYKKNCRKMIYPILEVGINNLIFLGQSIGYKGTDFPGYPKREFVSRKNMPFEKKYVAAISASVGFGIKIKKRLSYEFGANYNQIITASNNALSSTGKIIKGYPYSVGFKTGFNYTF